MDRLAHLLSRLSDTLEVVSTPLLAIARPSTLLAATVLCALSSLAGSMAARRPASRLHRRGVG